MEVRNAVQKRKKKNGEKNLQMLKLNSFSRSRFTSRYAPGAGGGSFKYIDVNYIPQHHNAGDYSKGNSNRNFTNLQLPKGTGLPLHNTIYGSEELARSQKHNMNLRGGLDVTLLDSHDNFLSLPKQDAGQNGLRPLIPNVINYNGISLPNYGSNRRCFQTYNKEGMSNLLNSRSRRSKLTHLGDGKYLDKRGVIISRLGPFWPPGYGPVCQCPEFIELCPTQEKMTSSTHQLSNDSSICVTTSGNNVWLSRDRTITNRVNQLTNSEPSHQQSHTSNNQSSNCQFGNQSDSDPSINVRTDNHPTNDEASINNQRPTNQPSTNHNLTIKNPSNFSPREIVVNAGNNRQPQNVSKPIWRGKPVIFDCERSSRAPLPHSVPEGLDESLVFESRFESGNLRQVRRIAEFEYELVLRTDMYTNRHTQWYYFRLQKAKQGRKYKFNIINFLKKDSLYNYGMKPLIYSEKLATNQKLGWHRIGEKINYAAWNNSTRNAILSLGMQYFCLEFEISFNWEDVEGDTIYLAHCYPYTYSDLRRHLDELMKNPDQSQHVKQEVLCETTAGNACFLLTITEFPDREKDKYKDFHQEKKGVVFTSRVHPGESQASWMMKGIIDFLTSDHPVAQQLRHQFIFKIVPMLNPDGVIVGNYRTSLAARDLNRNYRHPKQGTFPTIWHMKQMVDQFNKDHSIILYCDLHGHSRKHMVFMYGCERKAYYKKSGQAEQSGAGNDADSLDETRDFVEERLFPWLMHKLAPTRFSFHGSKFAVRKSKESTGRVVMFRQMKIWNSFTMEASFSGTNMGSQNGRHFNLEDFQAIGRKLCECVLEYARVCENPVAKSRAILDMTRDIAQQLLTKRDVSSNANLDVKLPNENIVAAAKSPPDRSSIITNNKVKSKEGDLNGVTSSISKQTDKNKNKISNKFDDDGFAVGNVAVRGDVINDVHLRNANAEEKQERANLSTKHDVGGRSEYVSTSNQSASLECIQEPEADVNCFQLLRSLNVHQTSLESETSSESNSDSEPEVPADLTPSGRKNRGCHSNSGGSKKKKRKKRQQKLAKSISAPSGLPAPSTKKPQEDSATKDFKSKMMVTNHPGYINKYANRSNGGIPIFAHERMKERAARRLAELKLAEEDRKEQERQLREQLLLAGIQDTPRITYELPVPRFEGERVGYSEICGVRFKVANQPRKVQYMLYNPYRENSPDSVRDRHPVVSMRFSPPSQLRRSDVTNTNHMDQANELYMPYRVQAPAGRLSNQRGLSNLTERSGSISAGSPTEPSNSQSSADVSDSPVDDIMYGDGVSPQNVEKLEPRAVVVPVQKYNVSFKVYKKSWKQKHNVTMTSKRRYNDAEELEQAAMRHKIEQNGSNSHSGVHTDPSGSKYAPSVSELLLPSNMDVSEVMTAHMRYPGQVHKVEAMRPLIRGRTISRGPPMVLGEPVLINEKSNDMAFVDQTKAPLRQHEKSVARSSLARNKVLTNEKLQRHEEINNGNVKSLTAANDNVSNTSKINSCNNPESLTTAAGGPVPLFVPRFHAVAPSRGSCPNTDESLTH